jgi:hypothetical protein
VTADNPIVTHLSSGYTHMRFGPQCFAQIPPGFNDDVIPDDYIFQPSWNRDTVNAWWAKQREAKT